MKKRILYITLSIVLFSLIFSLMGVEIVKRTSNAEFCSSCHIMTPMVETFKRDTHGGNNVHGFVANCTDCHLPHNNTLNYLWHKGKMGANDLFKVALTDTAKINWYAKRQERETFVFDSGCLDCHQKLFERTQVGNPKSLETHGIYLANLHSDSPLHCVSCHVTVGHNGEMRSELNKLYPEGYKFQLEQSKQH